MIRTKAKADAPNYRNGGPLATQVCVTCRHKSPTRDNWCNKFSFRFRPKWVCNAFRPDVEAVRERASNLASRVKAEMDEAQRKTMFASMGASGKLNARGADGKRSENEQSKINREIKNLLDSIDGNEGIEESIRPKGRAPKGEGKEFAAKRWLADRMQNMRRRAERLEARIAQNTGTKRQRKAATRASIVLDSVNEALKMSEYMVENLRDSGIPFSDSRELFNDVFAIPQALTGGM